MKPSAMLQTMMTEVGLTPTSLARATHGKTKQPQIHRFLNSDVAEPRRSTWAPVAKFLQIPVDAFFDPVVAQQAHDDFMRRTATGWRPSEDQSTPDSADTLARIMAKLPRESQLEVVGFAARLLAELTEVP